ncbi:AAA family ATPase [Desulfonatronum lacustre]|uniref:AAA family ATPase n=1 Tax=Desulfonatronum lacustre TaxID=66849 RepID=UPI00048BA7FF|nr:AAA family ATPase [Desulfonatronum lacustre]
MKKLPIGIQTFENMIRENFAYVDKTSFVAGLRDEGKYYFLSRPRRFGKSLLLSTIKAAFQGKKELFQGLYLEHNWDWETVHPVVHVSFGSGVTRSLDELQGAFSYILDEHAKAYAITSVYTDLRTRFADLIKTLHDTFGRQVVILVDEYDKPILDNGLPDRRGIRARGAEHCRVCVGRGGEKVERAPPLADVATNFKPGLDAVSFANYVY